MPGDTLVDTLPSITADKNKPDHVAGSIQHEREQAKEIDTPVKEWGSSLSRRYSQGDLGVNEKENMDESFDKFYQWLFSGNKKDSLIELYPSLAEFQRQTNNLQDRELGINDLPKSADSFVLYNPSSGRSRPISSFNDQLTWKLEQVMEKRLQAVAAERKVEDIKGVLQAAKFAIDARKLYTEFSKQHAPEIDQLNERLNYLGLTKNTVVQGEENHLVTALIKSANFGTLTSEDKGNPSEKVIKNVIATGENPAIAASGLHDERTLELIRSITQDKMVKEYGDTYRAFPELKSLVEWVVQQSISRQLLPREAVVPSRVIDLDKLKKEKDLGAEKDSNPNFQASNPLSLWSDPETGRRFIVKYCPEYTLQSDYFGLEVLKLLGVPTYEFYYGWIPNNNTSQRVLVSGFLEGFQDPSAFVRLPENVPKGMSKSRLPPEFHGNKYIQQAMLAEILIGEYNSKAHNFMIAGKSVQHLDQGASLTSTASGKFKGFDETISLKDIEDVIHCYPDWDYNATEPVNEAYAKIATVENSELVIHDTHEAQLLLNRLRLMPQDKIDEALVHAGYTDGASSIDRMRSWITKIETDLLPSFYPPPEGKGTDPKKFTPSARRDQYVRWANSAVSTFEKAISMGGELSYYKHALRTRRASLEKTWQEAIDKAKNKSN